MLALDVVAHSPLPLLTSSSSICAYAGRLVSSVLSWADAQQLVNMHMNPAPQLGSIEKSAHLDLTEMRQAECCAAC